MSNYIDNVSITGLMNKNGIICEDYPLSFYKVKNKSKIVVCGEILNSEEEQKFKQVNYMYLNEDPKIKGSYKMTQVVSEIDSKNIFFNRNGKEFRELRETVNKFDRMRFANELKIEELSARNIDDVLNMINEWENSEKGGRKYMWQSHPGIDKNVVNRYVYGDLKKETIGIVFYIKDKCVGYSCISMINKECNDGIDEYNYLTRKTLNNYRNLTLYIDYCTFAILFKMTFYPNKFRINWGCSSGGVLKYKTSKWPVYSLEDKYFLTVKNI